MATAAAQQALCCYMWMLIVMSGGPRTKHGGQCSAETRRLLQHDGRGRWAPQTNFLPQSARTSGQSAPGSGGRAEPGRAGPEAGEAAPRVMIARGGLSLHAVDRPVTPWPPRRRATSKHPSQRAVRAARERAARCNAALHRRTQTTRLALFHHHQPPTHCSLAIRPRRISTSRL